MSRVSSQLSPGIPSLCLPSIGISSRLPHLCDNYMVEEESEIWSLCLQNKILPTRPSCQTLASLIVIFCSRLIVNGLSNQIGLSSEFIQIPLTHHFPHSSCISIISHLDHHNSLSLSLFQCLPGAAILRLFSTTELEQ